VPRVPVLHPEFGYIGTPSFSRGLIAFVVCGLVAGASAVSIFKADPDPRSAMALAPAEALSSTARSSPRGIAESNSGKGEFAQETPTTGAMKPRCQKNATEHLGGDCIAGQTRRPRSILALNERPAIAAVPIGHRDDPAVLPPEPAAPAVAALPEDADTATPAETPSAEPASPASLPAVTPTKTRERHRERAQRREGDRARRREREHHEYASTPRHYSNRQAYQARGYAGLW
jgi:hypothetical protein